MISDRMNPVKKAKILELHMKIVDLNASIQAFNALQTPTLGQKLRKLILEKRKAITKRTLDDLLVQPDNIIPDDTEDSS